MGIKGKGGKSNYQLKVRSLTCDYILFYILTTKILIVINLFITLRIVYKSNQCNQVKRGLESIKKRTYEEGFI